MEVGMSPKKSTWNILLILTGRPYNKNIPRQFIAFYSAVKMIIFSLKKMFSYIMLTPHYENLPCNI